MATFLELVTEIEGDISASNANLLNAQVKLAINRAIDMYEDERFRFNEGETTFSTAAGTPDYDLTSEAPNVLDFDGVQFLHGGRNYDLREESWDWYRAAAVDADAELGPPNHYAIHAEKMYLYPTPNAVSTVTISGLHRLTPTSLAADGDTNAWLTKKALMLIKHRAKADLFANRYYNATLAQFNNDIANDYLIQLRGERDRWAMAKVAKQQQSF